MNNVLDTQENTQPQQAMDVDEAADALLKRWEDAEKPSEQATEEATDLAQEADEPDQEDELEEDQEDEEAEIDPDETGFLSVETLQFLNRCLFGSSDNRDINERYMKR